MTHRPRKRFGQNFLQDPAVIARILSTIHPLPGEQLVEIGPGRGALTTGLLQAAGRLLAVELDRDLIEPLTQRCATLGELVIHSADALAFDFCSLCQPGGRLRIIGNLPYNISTPLLFHLLTQSHCILDMHFMLQREVVRRMSAQPGSKTYGRLSVMLQSRASVIPLFDIGPGAFQPRPRVESSFVRLLPHPSPVVSIDDSAAFGRLVTQAFSHRRKTLRNALEGLVTAETMERLGIDPGLRPERLTLEEFAKLSNSTCKAPGST